MDGNTLEVAYEYADGSGDNTARRTAVIYPNEAASPNPAVNRKVNLLYPATADDRLSRVGALQIEGDASNLCEYTFVGLARYVKIVYVEPAVQLSYIKTGSQPVGDAGDPYTGYDRFGRTVDMRWEATSGGAIKDHFQWGYDRAGNRTWRKNLAATGGGQDEHYRYDELYQVKRDALGTLNLNRTAIGGIPAEEERFDYDPTGNWLGYEKAEDGTTAIIDQSRVNNQDNQIVQIDGESEGIAYDRAGNATLLPPDKTGDFETSYTLIWDAWNRLVEVKDGTTTIATYAYDGQTRRTTKTVSGTTTHFYYNDRWKSIHETEGAAVAPARQYVWGERPGHRDELILRGRDTTANGTLDERLYALMDYFNCTSIVDTSGNVEERYAYSAFGAQRIMAPDFSDRTSSSFDWDFNFQGQFFDNETGYYNYGYRYYASRLGRWPNRDPIEEEGGTNLYKIHRNNSIGAVDYLGLFGGFGLYFDTNQMPCCDGVPYQPLLACCIDGTLYSYTPIDTGVSIDSHTYPLGDNPIPCKLDHQSIAYPGGSVGVYPPVEGQAGGLFGGGGEADMPNEYGRDLQSPDSAYNQKGVKTKSKRIKLSPCYYDIKKFVSCISSATEQDFKFDFFLVLNDCRSYVKKLISKCKRKARRKR